MAVVEDLSPRKPLMPLLPLLWVLVATVVAAVDAAPPDLEALRAPTWDSEPGEEEYAAYDEHAYEDGDEYSGESAEDKEDVHDDDEDGLVLGPRRGRHAQHHGRRDQADKVPAADPKASGIAPHITFESQQPGEDAGRCPPPLTGSWSWTGSCSVPRCSSDQECGSAAWPGQGVSGSSRRRCCFNGCAHTCLVTEDPPLVVDWEEETPGDVLPVPVLVPARPQQPQHSRAAPEVVALVGGCTVSPAEHRKFEDFKRGGHVRKCFCNNGALVCQVNTR